MMSSSNQQEKMIRLLNYLMIILSVFASITIFTTCETSVKLILALILMSYLCFFLRHNIINYFIGENSKANQYSQVRRLNAPIQQRQTKYDFIKNNSMLQENSKRVSNNSYANQSKNEEANQQQNVNTNYSRFNESFDLKDLSFEVVRSLSRSKIQQNLSGELSRSRSKGESSLKHIDNSFGKSFSDLFFQNSGNMSMSQSSMGSSRLINNFSEDFLTIRPRQYINNESYDHIRENLQYKYRKTLSEMKIQNLSVVQSYQKIIIHLWRIMKRLHFENLRIQNSLKELVETHFSVRISTTNSQRNFDSDLSKNSKVQMSMKEITLKLCLLYFKKIGIKDLGFHIKYDLDTPQFESRFQGIFREKLIFDQSIGCRLISRTFTPEEISAHLNEKEEKIEIISNFLIKNEERNFDLRKKREQKQNQKFYKDRIYMLFLFTRYMNNLLTQNEGKIFLNDGIYLNHERTIFKNDYQIEVSLGYDFMIPHYNLKKKGAQINCEPGQNNYASIIFLYLYNLSLQERFLYRNQELYRIIQEVILL